MVTFLSSGASYVGGSLIVDGALAEDVLTIIGEGTLDGQIGVSGTSISYGGVTIGTLSGGIGTDPLVVTFGAGITDQAIEALIERIGISNASDTPTEYRDLTIRIIEAGGRELHDITTPSFTEIAGAEDPFAAFDVGTYAAPIFADLDGDGDYDMIAGSETTGIHLLINSGNAETPEFKEITGSDNAFDGILSSTYSQPALADLDGDGDLDLMACSIGGQPVYYENVGDAVSMSFAQRTGVDNPFSGLPSLPVGMPELVDLDQDDDFDLVVGTPNGTISYFENTGDASVPAFAARTGTANPFNLIDVGDYASIAFYDIDGNGRLDLVSGNSSGSIKVFKNVGSSASQPAFLTADNLQLASIDVTSYAANGFVSAAPTFVDLDDDGDLDLVVGTTDGTVHWLKNTAAAGKTISMEIVPQDDPSTAIALAGVTASLSESTATASRIKIADFTVTDVDGVLGTALVTGSDASLFEIVSGSLYLKAGATLDFETNGTLDVSIDIVRFSTTDVSTQISVAITDALERIDGTGRANILTGGIGMDEIHGKGGNDTISGLGADDILFGDAGADRLTGGRGVDVMSGGSGGDLFIFQAGSTGDTRSTADSILDFNASDGDMIDLGRLDARSDRPGDQAFSFIGSAGFDGRSGLLRVVKTGSETIISGDIDGDKSADIVIRLDDPMILSKDAFVL